MYLAPTPYFSLELSKYKDQKLTLVSKSKLLDSTRSGIGLAVLVQFSILEY
jgi:hypothetical protein